MKPQWLLFVRLILRPLLREPVRTALTVLAVALGVAVVVAIDLAGRAAAGSFHSSLESLTGKGDLLITGTGGVDQSVLARLVSLPYAFTFSPRIETFTHVNDKGEAIPFIGLDLVGNSLPDELQRRSTTQMVELLSQGDPVWAGRSLGLREGEHVRLLINDAMHDFTVAGVLKPRPGEIGEQNVIVADIGLAMKIAARHGKLDSIDVRVPPGRTLEAWRALLKQQLPASLSVEPQGTRTDENRKMLAAFRWNLRVLSYIALVVGGFLIYNTISISVVRRRNEIGVIRALGAERKLITYAFLIEALFLALIGSAAGLLLGRAMAVGAVRLIGSTVEALYVSSQPAPIEYTVASVLTGLGLGITISVLAALAPAIEAARVAPVEAMARGREEYVAAVRSRRTWGWALAALVLGCALTKLPPLAGKPIFAYLAVMLLIAGTAALIPNIVGLFAGTLSQWVEKLIGVEALLAMRSLRASVGRTSVLAAALATAVAMTASVGIMVGSFRRTVAVWMNDQLQADFYLRPAGSPAADQHPTIDPGIATRIAQIPGVASVERFRAYAISYQGLPATLAGSDTSPDDSATTEFLPGENGSAILRKLPAADFVVVSEPFSNKHSVHVGSVVTLPVGGARRRFTVLGIYYDYSAESGYIVLAWRTLMKYLPDPAASSLGVYLKSHADSAAVRRQIDLVIGGRAVAVFPNAELRRNAIATFDRTFRITYALEAVAVIVAIMGIAGALLAMVIDRRREFALLRFLGAAKSQVRAIILCEAGLLGLLANAIGLVLGTALSLVLIFVINKQSFGWTIQFHWPVLLVLIALTVIYAATVIAGLYPAQTALRLDPIEVIHEE